MRENDVSVSRHIDTFLGHFRYGEKSYALPCGSRRAYLAWSSGDWPAATFQAKLPGCIEVQWVATTLLGPLRCSHGNSGWRWLALVSHGKRCSVRERVRALDSRRAATACAVASARFAELEALCALGCDVVMSAVG